MRLGVRYFDFAFLPDTSRDLTRWFSHCLAKQGSKASKASEGIKASEVSTKANHKFSTNVPLV